MATLKQFGAQRQTGTKRVMRLFYNSEGFTRKNKLASAFNRFIYKERLGDQDV